MTKNLLSKQQINKLHNTFLFKDMNKDFFYSVIESDDCYVREYEKDEIIYDYNNFLNCLAYINKGEIVVNSNSSVFLLRQIKENNFFGVATLFSDNEEYISEIVARKKCQIIFFNEELIERCIKNSFEFSLNYIKFLTSRIVYLNKKIDLITNDSNNSKLMTYLLTNIDKNNEIVIDGSFAKLAKSLNMGRSSLYREFDELEAKKIIKKSGKKILVLSK